MQFYGPYSSMSTRRQMLTTGGVVGAGLLAGCLPSSESAAFGFERVVFSADSPENYDSYEDVTDTRTFSIDDPVWLLVAVESAPTADDGTATLEYTFQTDTPDGETWGPVVEREEDWEGVEASDVLIVWERFPTYPEDQPGEYEMTITVEDQVDGQRLRTAETFTLENGRDTGTGRETEHRGRTDRGSDTVPDYEQYTFDVQTFAFTTERARRFGEYTEQPDATFTGGEIVWIYVELSNVTPVGGPNLTIHVEFVSPDGEVLGSNEDVVDIPDGQLEALPNEAFVTEGIDTSAFNLPSSGEYTTNVSITDRRSGESVEVSRPVTLRLFEFDSVVFTDGEPEAFEEHEAKEGATYTAGEEDVWFYVAVRNAQVDDSGKAVLEYTFDVEAPDGSTWEQITRNERWERVEPGKTLYYGQALATFEDDPLGTYELTITVRDKVADYRIRTKETFTLD